jgi:hypothetical protein
MGLFTPKLKNAMAQNIQKEIAGGKTGAKAVAIAQRKQRNSLKGRKR